MNPDGSCLAGFMKCGNPASKSKGICLPSRFKYCPLTEITRLGSLKHRQISFTSAALFITNDTFANPIDRVRISENHLCFNKFSYSLTPGRTKYPLLDGDFSDCQKDMESISVTSLGEREIFDKNSVPYPLL